MHHGFNAVLAQHLGQTIGLGDVADDQAARGVGYGRDVPLQHVVIGDGIVSVAK